MKMVKSLLLGTAAGFVAVAGAQAADMPVKGAAVHYVKICSLYGDGFYYLPGTDICVKIGGYVRMQSSWAPSGGQTNWAFYGGNLANDSNTRTDGNGDWSIRARAYISMDTRQQTEYGVLRTYINIGINGDSPTGATFSGNRAFIQFAGFTVGLAQSFYDFYSSPATSFFGPPSSDTGDGGWRVAAYTQNWGNGITSTVSLEESRRQTIVNGRQRRLLCRPDRNAWHRHFGTERDQCGDPGQCHRLPIRHRDGRRGLRPSCRQGGLGSGRWRSTQQHHTDRQLLPVPSQLHQGRRAIFGGHPIRCWQRGLLQGRHARLWLGNGWCL